MPNTLNAIRHHTQAVFLPFNAHHSVFGDAFLPAGRSVRSSRNPYAAPGPLKRRHF
jgi:hypothetical protein